MTEEQYKAALHRFIDSEWSILVAINVALPIIITAILCIITGGGMPLPVFLAICAILAMLNIIRIYQTKTLRRAYITVMILNMLSTLLVGDYAFVTAPYRFWVLINTILAY
jgi:CDP-diglyceride synthetase